MQTHYTCFRTIKQNIRDARNLFRLAKASATNFDRCRHRCFTVSTTRSAKRRRRFEPPPSAGGSKNEESLSKTKSTLLGAFYLEVTPGFEPGNNGFADRGLTTWLCHLIFSLFHLFIISIIRFNRILYDFLFDYLFC